MGHVDDNCFVVNGSVYDENHQGLKEDGAKEHDPELISVLDHVENSVYEGESNVQNKDR